MGKVFKVILKFIIITVIAGLIAWIFRAIAQAFLNWKKSR